MKVPTLPSSIPQYSLFCIISISLIFNNILQVDGLFLLKHKLAFAPQTNGEVDGSQMKEGAPTPLPLNHSKLVLDDVHFQQEVEKIYEKWMLDKRNQMFSKMKQGLAKPAEAKAFQEILEHYFGTCICNADPVICQIYDLSC